MKPASHRSRQTKQRRRVAVDADPNLELVLHPPASQLHIPVPDTGRMHQGPALKIKPDCGPLFCGANRYRRKPR